MQVRVLDGKHCILTVSHRKPSNLDRVGPVLIVVFEKHRIGVFELVCLEILWKRERPFGWSVDLVC